MNKVEFARLFRDVVQQAIKNAESRLKSRLPQNARFLLNGWGSEHPTMDETDTLEQLYINEHSFYRIIDIGVIRFNEEYVFIVARRSGHEPTSFDKTWNDPKGLGPFKQIMFAAIENCAK
jgi:hypothetical protein